MNFIDGLFDEHGVYRGLLQQTPERAVCRFDACRTIFRPGPGLRDSCARCAAVKANAERTGSNVESAVRRDCETQIGRLQRELIQRIVLRGSAA